LACIKRKEQYELTCFFHQIPFIVLLSKDVNFHNAMNICTKQQSTIKPSNHLILYQTVNVIIRSVSTENKGLRPSGR